MRMAFELQMLAAAVIIGIVHLLWGAAAAPNHRGVEWDSRAPGEPRLDDRGAGRGGNGETFPFFAVLVVVDYLGGRLGELTSLGALIYVVARAVYIPLYAFGVPYVRSLTWVASMVGILMLLAALVV
jgi:uncharacterized MAPEG superfamily protein